MASTVETNANCFIHELARTAATLTLLGAWDPGAINGGWGMDEKNPIHEHELMKRLKVPPRLYEDYIRQCRSRRLHYKAEGFRYILALMKQEHGKAFSPEQLFPDPSLLERPSAENLRQLEASLWSGPEKMQVWKKIDEVLYANSRLASSELVTFEWLNNIDEKFSDTKNFTIFDKIREMLEPIWTQELVDKLYAEWKIREFLLKGTSGVPYIYCHEHIGGYMWIGQPVFSSTDRIPMASPVSLSVFFYFPLLKQQLAISN